MYPILIFYNLYIYNFLKVLSHFFIKKVNLNKYFFDKDILSKSKLFIQIISFSLIFFNSIRKINIKWFNMNFLLSYYSFLFSFFFPFLNDIFFFEIKNWYALFRLLQLSYIMILIIFPKLPYCIFQFYTVINCSKSNLILAIFFS